jgi:hypothetical protein
MSPKRCGNAGAVESVESQGQASHSFHEPLGNLAKDRRDSHIPTAPTTKADGKVENQNQVFHFPTAALPLSENRKHKNRWGGFAPARQGASRLATGSDPWSSRHSSSRSLGAGVQTKPTKGDIPQQPSFQAHPVMESHSRFRLISHWNQFLISGSFVDWKMLQQNCPTRDEPEREVRFQYGMSLKRDFDSNAG